MRPGSEERASAVTIPPSPQFGPTPPRLIDVDTVADWLGMTPRHVRMLVRQQRIPYLRWSRRLKFDPQQIAGWLDSIRVPATQGTGGPNGMRREEAVPGRRVRVQAGLDEERQPRTRPVLTSTPGRPVERLSGDPR